MLLGDEKSEFAKFVSEFSISANESSISEGETAGSAYGNFRCLGFDILPLEIEGQIYKEVTDEFSVSPFTVKDHMTKVLSRLNC